MIDVKLIPRPKKGSSSSSSLKTVILEKTAEADHASRADRADSAGYADRAGYADKSAYADTAYDLSSDSPFREEYLSRKHDDTAEGRIKFNKGIESDGDDVFNGKVTFKDTLTVLKQIVLGSAGYGIGSDGGAVLEDIRSLLFSTAEQSGFGLVKEGGKYKMYLTALEVWGKAVFHELEIRKLSYAGGNIVLSPSGGTVMRADEVRDKEGVLLGWKCWLMQDDGTTATMNLWRVDDQAKCQTFNIKKPGTYEDAANRYYWRRVTEVGTEDEQLTDGEGHVLYDGRKFGWIVLSAEDCDPAAENDIPAAGDVLVLDGNRTDTERQNVLMLETNGAGAPRIVGFKNVYTYSHEGRSVIEIGPGGVRFESKSFKWIQTDGSTLPVQNYRGQWVEDAQPPYTYYDIVDHEGTEWLCIVPEGQTATDEPSAESGQWRNLTPLVGYGMRIDIDGQTTVDWGETVNVSCSVVHGTEDVDTTLGWTWQVSRDSGDKAEDTAWGQKDKAKAFAGEIALGFNAEENDLGNPGTSPYGTKFTFTASKKGTRIRAVGELRV